MTIVSYSTRRKKENLVLQLVSKNHYPDESWKFIPQNPVCRFIQTTGLMAIKDNMVLHSQDVVRYALKRNISLTLLIVLISHP